MWEKIVAAWNAVPEVLSEGVGWLVIQLTGVAHPPAVVVPSNHDDDAGEARCDTTKSHDHPAFYKYRNAQGAIRLLRDLQLAWVSPLRFDDPFDTQIEIRFGCTGAELIDRLP